MVDTNILGCVWIELPPNKWYLRSSTSSHSKVSRCQIECDISWEDFIAHAPEGEWGDVAQFRIHSFDIECAGRKGKQHFECPTLKNYFFWYYYKFS